MRNLHRDIGFLMIGLTLIYVLSGILLIYRDSDFFKFEQTIENKLVPDLNAQDLGRELHMRRFRVENETNDSIYFANGYYVKSTGFVHYTQVSHPELFNKMNSLHKRASRDSRHWFSIVYAILLGFLAISSFWMFKPSSSKFKRGMILSGIGLILALVLIYL